MEFDTVVGIRELISAQGKGAAAAEYLKQIFSGKAVEPTSSGVMVLVARTFCAVSAPGGGLEDIARRFVGGADATHVLKGETIMSRKRNISTFAATIATSLLVSAATASSGSLSPGDNQSRYLPIQSISYAFGSISISGYYMQQAATCVVMLTVVDRNVAEEAMPVSPVRVRMALQPGQIAGLDSEDGHALNVTCTEGAASLLVDIGERDRLADLQAAALPAAIAGSP